MGMKAFPTVAWPSLKARKVIGRCESMSGCSGVAHPGLRLVRGTLQNKPPDNPSWTLDEGEEMRRDINDLKKKTVTKDELQEMEAKLEEKMDGLKEEILEVLKNLVMQEHRSNSA
jgi:hypothetical protein